jgi:hypothetical protein
MNYFKNGVSSLCLVAAIALSANGQDISALNKAVKDTTWKSKTEFGANFNQGSFNNAWTGGGVNSIALGVFFNALRELKEGKHTWRNDLQSQYGIVKNQGLGARKSFDRLFFDSKYGYDLSKSWSLVGNVNFQTQFAPGYNFETDADGMEIRKRISSFLAPGYLTEAIGIQYSPAPYFYVTFSPGAFRQTFVMDTSLYVNTPDQTNYGVEIGKRFRNEVALAQVIANFDKEIAKDITLKWRYQMFASADKNRNVAFHTDHRLDANITAKLHKYFNVNLGVIMLYDDDQVSRVQWAQALSVGFLYAF